MSQHQDHDKNMIRCQAKIRTTQSELTNSKLLAGGFLKKVIRIKQPELPEFSNTAFDLEPKIYSKASQNQLQGCQFMDCKLTQDDLQSTKPFSKINLEDSWARTQNEQTISMICKQQFTKRLQCTDFPDFQKNIIPLINGEYDNSFDESIILQNYHFESAMSKNKEPFKDYGYQKLLQEKNNQIINILVAKNEEKKLLEKKIFDLQFQIFIQKRDSEGNIKTMAESLKASEVVCENLNTQIQRLNKQLKISQQQKAKNEQLYEAKTNQFQNCIGHLQNRCNQLMIEIKMINQQLQISRNENQRLKQINAQASILKIDEYGNQLFQNQIFQDNNNSSELHQQLNVINNQFQNNTINNIQQQQNNIQNNIQSQQSVESHSSYLQSLIKQYQKQLLQKKKKIKEQKKHIIHLEQKISHLESVGVSLDIVNQLLEQTNHYMMTLQLKQLQSKFQSHQL